MQNAATVINSNKHACILKWLKKFKPPVARKLAVRHTNFACLTATFLATGGFVKLFHKIPWFFHDYSGFFKFHDFSRHGTFFSWFFRFFMIPELVGTLFCTSFSEWSLIISVLSHWRSPFQFCLRKDPLKRLPYSVPHSRSSPSQ